MTSDYPAVFVLRTEFDIARLKPIDATHALARWGMPMLRPSGLPKHYLRTQRVSPNC